MDIEKIEKFIDAGYTKEEINAMLSGGNAGTVQTQNEDGNEGAKPEKSEESGAEVQEHDGPLEMLKTLTSTVEGLKDTVKALQAANVKNADSGAKTPENEINNIMDSFIKTL